jgi:hypothetical protein
MGICVSDLNMQTQQWSTPRAEASVSDGRGTFDHNKQRVILPDGTQTTRSLNHEVVNWPTPRSHEVGEYQNQTSGPPIQTLDGQSRSFLPVQQTSTDGAKSSASTRRLNPRFVEWLMGWPLGVTGYEFSATEFARWQEQMRSCLLRLVCAKEPHA